MSPTQCLACWERCGGACRAGSIAELLLHLGYMELAAAQAPLAPQDYVLLISGTMNPPHSGHVRLGLSAADRLRAHQSS